MCSLSSRKEGVDIGGLYSDFFHICYFLEKKIVVSTEHGLEFDRDTGNRCDDTTNRMITVNISLVVESNQKPKNLHQQLNELIPFHNSSDHIDSEMGLNRRRWWRRKCNDEGYRRNWVWFSRSSVSPEIGCVCIFLTFFYNSRIPYYLRYCMSFTGIIQLIGCMQEIIIKEGRQFGGFMTKYKFKDHFMKDLHGTNTYTSIPMHGHRNILVMLSRALNRLNQLSLRDKMQGVKQKRKKTRKNTV
ncbi:hypothetical protein LXL04_018174 [Taraxacum kok-saghyz]